MDNFMMYVYKISSGIWQWKNFVPVYICRSYDQKSSVLLLLTDSVGFWCCLAKYWI